MTVYALGMVACAGSHHGGDSAALPQAGDLVAGAADLEGAGFLPVLALQIDLSASQAGKGIGQIQFGMVEDRPQPGSRLFNVLQGDVHRSASG